MNRLPTPPPLPTEVRERALRTVLAGMDAPPRRGRAPVVAAAAAVVVALTVSVVVALTGPRAGSIDHLASGPPPRSGDAVTDPALLRCAQAVQAAGRADSYPPTGTWRATALLLHDGIGDTAIAIDDAFACFAAPTQVFVSSTRGTPAGAVGIALLTPAVGVVLNPQRLGVTITGGGTTPPSTAPVQYVEFGTATSPGRGYSIDVRTSYAGPLPAPAPVGLLVDDAPPQTRAPEPGTLVPGGTALDDCVAGSMPGAELGLDLAVPGRPARAGTVGDGYGGFCVQGRTGPVFAAGAVAPVAAGAAPRVVAVTRSGGVTGVLAAVAPDVTGVDLAVVGGGAWDCTMGSGLALCTTAGSPAATLNARDSAGRTTHLRLP